AEVLTRLDDEIRQSGSPLTVLAPSAVVGHWDRLRLEQVITNLVTNAAKYGAGRPVTVSVNADAGWGRLIVQDQGIGIAPEHVERIFAKFERAVSARHYGGLGLGLF